MEYDETQLDRLMSNLGYTFNAPQLLVQALTHRSFANEHSSRVKHNERLEFLGDAVLDLAVGCQLMEMLPSAREGQLTKLRSSIVSEDGLARCARRLDLGPYLRLSHGEERTGGRDKPSILADSYEAVMGAVFLDGGFSDVNLLVWRLMEPLLNEAAGGPWTGTTRGISRSCPRRAGRSCPSTWSWTSSARTMTSTSWWAC